MATTIRVLALLGAALSGCASPARLELSRFDGAPIDPVAQEQAGAECTAKAQVATAGVPHQMFGDGYGIGRAIEQAQVRQAAFQGCMAEKGIRAQWVQDSTPTETASIRQATSQ